jgi:hypothetical protein
MSALRDPVVALSTIAPTSCWVDRCCRFGRTTIATPSSFLLERDTRVVDPRPAPARAT